jgi:hypothetical protein
MFQINELKDNLLCTFTRSSDLKCCWNSIMFGNILSVTTHKPIRLWISNPWRSFISIIFPVIVVFDLIGLWYHRALCRCLFGLFSETNIQKNNHESYSIGYTSIWIFCSKKQEQGERTNLWSDSCTSAV